MRTTIKATNIEHTNAIDAYLAKRLAELERILEPKEKSELARLDIGKTSKHHKEGKEIYYAEITFHVKKKDFRAVAKAGHDSA
jgi:ribosome-associated translation inhibitor RaiA